MIIFRHKRNQFIYVGSFRYLYLTKFEAVFFCKSYKVGGKCFFLLNFTKKEIFELF